MVPAEVVKDAVDDPEDVFDADLFVDKSYSVEEVDINGIVIHLEALHSAASTDFDLTGQIVWPASRLLSLYLATRGLGSRKCPKVLELGAGVGLAGLVAARAMTPLKQEVTSSRPEVTSSQPEVVLTDNQEEVLKVLERNVEINVRRGDGGVKLRCAHLAWGENLDEFRQEHGTFGTIIGADVVFWPSAVPLLFETAAALLNPDRSSRLIIAYISRSEFSTKLMYESATKSGFEWNDYDLTSDDIFSTLLSDQKACGRQAHLLTFTLKSSQHT